MKFAPAPDNDFRDFYETYFARCRVLVPNIRVIAVKWTFEDFIPGLSNFDTRFVVDNAMWSMTGTKCRLLSDAFMPRWPPSSNIGRATSNTFRG